MTGARQAGQVNAMHRFLSHINWTMNKSRIDRQKSERVRKRKNQLRWLRSANLIESQVKKVYTTNILVIYLYRYHSPLTSRICWSMSTAWCGLKSSDNVPGVMCKIRSSFPVSGGRSARKIHEIPLIYSSISL